MRESVPLQIQREEEETADDVDADDVGIDYDDNVDNNDDGYDLFAFTDLVCGFHEKYDLNIKTLKTHKISKNWGLQERMISERSMKEMLPL